MRGKLFEDARRKKEYAVKRDGMKTEMGRWGNGI